MLKEGINHCTNAEYHGDSSWLSSSNLKVLLKDPQQFYKEKILGEKPTRKENSSFDEGSLTHSLILEPHLVNEEFAFYPGLKKMGEDFEKFKAMHQNKIIISRPQKVRCDAYAAAYRKNPLAVELLQGGQVEHTICQNLSDVAIKVRCDYINVEKGFIADVKTTSFPADVDTFRMTVKQWGYELSAALYTATAAQYYGKNFDFYFVVIDKKNLVCEVYKMSDATMQVGTLQVAEALKLYKHYKKTNRWEKENKIITKCNEEILEV